MHPYYQQRPEKENSIKALFNRLKNFILAHKIISAIIIVIVLIALADLIPYFLSHTSTIDDSNSSDSTNFTPEPSASDNADTTVPIDTFTPKPIVFSTPTPHATAQATPKPSPTASPTAAATASTNLTPDTSHSSLSANPASIPADGTTKSTITVTLHDSNGNAVSGEAITLSSSTGVSFTPASTGSNVTNSSGQATFTVTSTTPGTDAITVVATTSGGTSATLTNLGSMTFIPVSSPIP